MEINNDEDYFNALEAIRKGAAYIANPLTDEAHKAAANRKYDRLCKAARAYRISGLLIEFPGLREVYAKLGWEYNEPKQAEGGAPTEQLQELGAPEPDPEVEPVEEPKKPAANLSAWLDD